jgi:signal transduction histidine kinase
MGMPERIVLAAGLCAVLAAAAAIWLNHRKMRKIMDGLEHMLDDAIRGDFREDRFDESLLSSVEARMAGYLTASGVSGQAVREERDKIRELIADISHQTKTPIANILLYAQLLEEQELPDESRRCAEALARQAEKLSFLIGSLVKTSRLETGILTLHPRPAPVSALLAELERQLAPKAARKGVALTVEDAEIRAVFDPKWTAEALCNVADNAVKYTPAGGHVTVRAAAYELFVRIDVADTGMGIPEDELPRIFQRFYRAPSAADAEGVGLGLFLAREILSEQGGYLKAASRVGQGSVFSLFLPMEGTCPSGGE